MIGDRDHIQASSFGSPHHSLGAPGPIRGRCMNV